MTSFMHRSPTTARQQRGLVSYLSGSAAEEQVLLEYLSRGALCLEQRWRGQSGEIDLIFRDKDTIVFAEVKSAPGHDRARESLRPQQMQRIYAAASQYLAHVPEGQLANVRFDLATVDRTGQIEITENAFGHF